MAGGTFKLSQPKVRPGVYANLKNGRQPTASGSARGTASIPLIGYDWGPRGKWIIISADSPDGHVAELGRSVYDETNSSMIMLQLLLLNAATVYVYIPDGGAAAKKTITVGSGSLTVTAKYKGTLGNTVKIVSVANPVDGFDVSVVINGSEVELFEGIKTMDELKGVSEYVDFSGTGEMAAFASATLEGGTDTVDGSGNSGISDFLDKSEKVRFNCMCFPSTESSLQTALLTKIKYIRESIGWKCQAVAPNFAAVEAGQTFFSVDDEGNVILEYDINSKVHIDSETPQDIKKNRPLRVYDSFENDCLITFRPGKFDNDEDGWAVVEGLGRSMLQNYSDDGALTNVVLDEDFLVDTGRSVGDSMYLNIGLQAVDSAEKFYISIVAR